MRIPNYKFYGMSEKGAFITESTFLIDGGATSSYYYGSLKPTDK